MTCQESVLVEKTKFKNPGEEIKKKLNNQDKEIKPEYRSNQFLGEFRVMTKYVKVVCRDHEYPDGDRVRLLVNDKTLIYEILLEAAPKEYYIDISDGFNKLDFVALNQGSSGPNTAAFSVFDDAGRLITSIDDLAKPTDGLPPTDGIRIWLDGGVRIIIRPSGTEAKMKCYIEAIERDSKAATVVLDQLRPPLKELLS